MYVIRCEVWGGETGRRSSTLKNNGEVETLDSLAAAQQEAQRLTAEMNHGNARASFRCWAEEA